MTEMNSSAELNTDTMATIKVYKEEVSEGNNVIEPVQSHIPETPAKKHAPQRQRSTRGIPMLSYSTSYLLEEDNAEAEHVNENELDCSGVMDTIIDSFGSLALDNKHVLDEWDFPDGYRAALGDFAKEDDGELLAFDLPSSQSSSNAEILENRSRGFSNIHGSFMPVPAHTTESISQYNLKNQELVDGGKYKIVDTKHVGTIKRKLHAGMLERPHKRSKKKKVYRPKVVRNLGIPIPRMEPKTPTKRNRRLKLNTTKIMKKNVTVKNSSRRVDLNNGLTPLDVEPIEAIVSERGFSSIDLEKHSEDGTIIVSEKKVDTGLGFLRRKKRTTMRKKWELKDYGKLLEPNLQSIKKKKRMGMRRREVSKWQNIASELQATNLKRRRYRKRVVNIFKTKRELFPCFIREKEALCIEESLTDLISSLESDNFRLISNSTDTNAFWHQSISLESNHGMLVCYQENEEPGPHVELGVVALASADGELGVLATTKKKGRRQKKLEELEHGELAHPWKLHLQNEVNEGNKHDKHNSKFWDGEREFFHGRIDLFLYRMRIVQGNRTFSEWDGSVMDSIIGVFLTQNVSDHLSSSAFISLAAAFPNQPSCNQELTYVKPRPSCEQSRILKIEELVEGAKSSSTAYCDEISTSSHGSVETIMVSDDGPFIQGARITMEYQNQKSSEWETTCRGESTQMNDFEGENYYVNMSGDQSNWWMNIITENSQSNFNEEKLKRNKSNVAREINNEGVLVNGRPDWDFFKRLYEKGEKIRPMDSVNWQAVRQADVDEVAEAIKGRGQHHIIAGRLKKFLDEVNQDHNEINLEWLRGSSDKLVRRYLTNIEGIGLKSVECVRLLALKQIAFPVDVNVGRIAIRLGWVPMQPLPDDVQIHILEEMPVMDNIQKYLWPRLMKLSYEKLYELHYQMITFGKVYCTKRNPNCHPCPMKNECKYYLSAYASAKHVALPKPMEKQPGNESGVVISDNLLIYGDKQVDPSSQSKCEHATKFEYQLEDCEPVIEEPTSFGSSSQQSEFVEGDIEDIEDLFRDNPFKQIVNKSPYRNAQEGNEKSFLTLEEAAFIPTRRLKEVNRLRTIHIVYEIEDGGSLFEELQLKRRYPHDKNPYMFALFTPDIYSCKGCKNTSCNADDTCSSCKSLSSQDDTVRGTLLIPCRTAMRGSFPLNGTYFQTNEVFMDHESSINPITVRRELLWQLSKRIVYCGTSTSTILKGLSTFEVFKCFLDGFICVRAFNRETRRPELLSERFHVPTAKATKKEKRRIPKEDDPTISSESLGSPVNPHDVVKGGY